MNYYEELGVRQDASIEDIRQAYKMTARLLHPDRQVDPNLKQIAERQMTRLGEIVAILANPRTRSHYDDVLLLGNRFQMTPGNRALLVPAPAGKWDGGIGMAEFALRYWFWILLSVLAIALSTWSFMQSNSTVPDRALPGEALQRDAGSKRQPMQSPPRRRINAGFAKGPSIPPANHAPGAEEIWTPKIALPEPDYGPAMEDIRSVLSDTPESSPEAADSPPITPPARSEWSFIGTWLYSPQSGDVAERGMYPAIYVELQLVEQGGEMVGDYHARYKVLDQAVSPEVTFQIRGTAESATSAKFAWVSRDNATGQAEIKLRGPNVIYVNWWTTAFGRQATLGSGSAVLIRQQVP